MQKFLTMGFPPIVNLNDNREFMQKLTYNILKSLFLIFNFQINCKLNIKLYVNQGINLNSKNLINVNLINVSC